MTFTNNNRHVQVIQSTFDAEFNDTLFQQFLAAELLDSVKKTHFFNGRFENLYLSDQHAPLLLDLKTDARAYASQIIGRPVRKMGCWFNAMPKGSETTLHSHDDDDEVLSGVYYIRAPQGSGKLIIHTPEGKITHTPQAGQWVFFSPQIPHEVSEHLADDLRLSVAFNFS
ncbi:MAG: putative 2OG-Fe(II) oxygenase [Arenicellales bacterium]